ncbi:MAG TPA: hypothetical protein VGH77_03505 [Streptosporangiaceae bacterium]|jgi:hypothetical protein
MLLRDVGAEQRGYDSATLPYLSYAPPISPAQWQTYIGAAASSYAPPCG